MPAGLSVEVNSESTVTVLLSTAVFFSRYLPCRTIGGTAQHYVNIFISPTNPETDQPRRSALQVQIRSAPQVQISPADSDH